MVRLTPLVVLVLWHATHWGNIQAGPKVSCSMQANPAEDEPADNIAQVTGVPRAAAGKGDDKGMPWHTAV